MALAVRASQPLGLRPAEQLECAAPAETLCLRENAEEEAKESCSKPNTFSYFSCGARIFTELKSKQMFSLSSYYYYDCHSYYYYPN